MAQPLKIDTIFENPVLTGFLLFVAGIGYALYGFHEFSTGPLAQLAGERQHLESELGKKQEELRRLREFSENIGRVKQELSELNAQLESVLEHMPRSFNLASLLRKLTMLSRNSGLNIATFRPSKSEDKKEGQFFSSTNIEMELEGSFTQTLLFLDQVSRLKRIVSIQNLSLGGQDRTTNPSGSVVRTNATIKTFRFSE